MQESYLEARDCCCYTYILPVAPYVVPQPEVLQEGQDFAVSSHEDGKFGRALDDTTAVVLKSNSEDVLKRRQLVERVRTYLFTAGIGIDSPSRQLWCTVLC